MNAPAHSLPVNDLRQLAWPQAGEILRDARIIVVPIGVARSLHLHSTAHIYFLNTGISTNWARENSPEILTRDRLTRFLTIFADTAYTAAPPREKYLT